MTASSAWKTFRRIWVICGATAGTVFIAWSVLAYPIPHWTDRIRRLIRTHTVIVNDIAFLVHVPDRGKIQVHTVISDPTIK